MTGEDQEQLTTRYTERAVDFIERNKDRPFLLYVPHSMVHVPLYVSDKFRGKSERGLFGDVVMELDWSVGPDPRHAAKRTGLDKNTMVDLHRRQRALAQLRRPRRLGRAAARRQGHDVRRRLPRADRDVVARHDPRRHRLQRAGHDDRHPAHDRPADRRQTAAEHTIDGKNIWPLIAGEPDAKSPHEAYFFYYGNQLQAVRMGKWKLHFPHGYRTLCGRAGGTGGIPVPYDQAKIGLALFDLEKRHRRNDQRERSTSRGGRPDAEAAERMREELGDTQPRRVGSGVRGPGRLEPGDLRFHWKPGEPVDVEATRDADDA